MFLLKKLFITIFPLLIVVIIDQLTKQWARGLVDITTLGLFKFQFVLNDGIILGHFSELPLKAKQVTLSTLGVFVLIFYFFSVALIPIRSKFISIGLSVLVGGIMGNVIDRFNGFSVVDFISLNISNLPYANLADFFQWLGYLLLGIGIYQDSRYYWPEIDLRNKYFIKPNFQLRFSFLISSITLASSILVLLFSFSFFRDDQSQIMINYFMYLGAGISIILSLVAFLVSLIVSHRIAGPIHAIQRHLRSTINNEKVTFKLRENDEFKEIQDDMNLLNQKIASQSQEN